MTSKKRPGFTLIELMVVLVIIGVFALVTVPHLVEQRRRNVLTDFTNMFEQSAADARILAMQTRRAVVMEYRKDKIWINTLEGANCWDDIAQRCVHNKGQKADDDNENEFRLDSEEYKHSMVSVCDIRYAAITSASGVSQCTQTVVSLSNTLALCYSGKGELYIRGAEDSGVSCSATGALSLGFSDWSKACPLWAAGGTVDDGGSGQTTSYSGAMFRANRYGNTSGGKCPLGGNPTGDVLGVTREIYIPAGGAPYSKVGI